MEWLGEVPSHWETLPVKRVASLQSGVQITAEQINETGPYPVFGGNGRRGFTTAFTHEGIFPLVGRQGALCGNINYGEGKFWASEHAVVVTPLQRLSVKWLGELLRVMNLGQHSTSAAQPGLAVEAIRELRVAVPPIGEQSGIAAFLDRETSKIDGLIEAQRRLIDLLREKHQVVNSLAVTKGLDPMAPMRPSGVEWLGDVPAHWEVSTIKRKCLTITDGAHISPETVNGEYHFVSTRDISEAGIDFENSLMTSASSYDYLVRAGCRPKRDDVLLSKDGTIGRTVVVRYNREFVVASSLIIARPNTEELNPEFLSFLFRSEPIRRQLDCFVKGAGLPRLSIQSLLRVVGVFPPRVEQEQIVVVLNNVTSSFGVLVAESECAITLLQERRAALISAAVIGKIDLRGLVPASELLAIEAA